VMRPKAIAILVYWMIAAGDPLSNRVVPPDTLKHDNSTQVFRRNPNLKFFLSSNNSFPSL
jgi:hypothetical protein